MGIQPVTDYDDTIRKYAAVGRRAYCSSIPIDDLVQEGFKVLLDVVRRGVYNPAKSKATFRTYLTRCLMNHYRDLGRKSVRHRYICIDFIPEPVVESRIVAQLHELTFFENVRKTLSPLAQTVFDMRIAAFPDRVSVRSIAADIERQEMLVSGALKEIKTACVERFLPGLVRPPKGESRMSAEEGAPKRSQFSVVKEMLNGEWLTRAEILTKLNEEFPGSCGTRIPEVLRQMKKEGVLARRKREGTNGFEFSASEAAAPPPPAPEPAPEPAPA